MTTETTTETTAAPTMTTTRVPATKAAAKKAVKKVTNKSDAAVKKHANAGNTSVKAPAKKVAKTNPNTSGTHDGTKVGWKYKTTVDTHWNAARVVFYTALRKIGGSGTAQQISEASKGEIAVGNCLHFGYHGVTPGFNKIQQLEGVRGFTFTLTAKGKTMDLDKMLAKSQADRAKAKAAAKAE